MAIKIFFKMRYLERFVSRVGGALGSVETISFPRNNSLIKGNNKVKILSSIALMYTCTFRYFMNLIFYKEKRRCTYSKDL